MSEYDLTDNEIQDIFNRYWAEEKSDKDFQANDNPKGIVLGGQPGAGKSNATARLKLQHFGENVVEINGDEFRELHPAKKEIDHRFGEESVKHTAQLAGRMTQMSIDRAIEERLNVIVEGTFRTAETPIKTLSQFKNAGYETGVVIATTEAEISWQSTHERYDEMKKSGQSPRYTPKAGHDLTVDNLGKNADKVYQSGLADTFTVANRHKELWNSTQAGLPSQAINEELSRNKLNVLDIDKQKLLAEVNQSIEKLDISFQEQEKHYSNFREALLNQQEKGLQMEQGNPGRTYTGEILAITDDKVFQQTKLGKLIEHDIKNLPGIEQSDFSNTIKIRYEHDNKGKILEGQEISTQQEKNIENEKSSFSSHGLGD